MKRILSALFALLFISSALNAQQETDIPKVRIGFQGGVGYRPGDISVFFGKANENYLSGLKTGTDLGASFCYYLPENVGAGLLVNRFHTSNQVNASISYQDGSSEEGILADNISMILVTPYVSVPATPFGPEHLFFLNFGLGYLGYLDNARMASKSIEVNSATAGIFLGFDYDIRIGKRIAIGAGLSLIGGPIFAADFSIDNKLTAANLEKTDKLLQFTACIGIRFYP